MISSTKAHDGPIWSIDLRADGGGVVSGSADKDVKFWDIVLKDVEGPGSKIITRMGEERTVSRAYSCCVREYRLITISRSNRSSPSKCRWFTSRH